MLRCRTLKRQARSFSHPANKFKEKPDLGHRWLRCDGETAASECASKLVAMPLLYGVVHTSLALLVIFVLVHASQDKIFTLIDLATPELKE